MSPYSCPLVIILLHAHLHTIYYEHIKFHWNPSNRLEENCAYKIYPAYFISKNSKSNYLPLKLSVGNHVASCASTYHVFIKTRQTL